MTVRWKPLLVMSALFLVVGLIGVVAITITLAPRSAQAIVRKARTAHESGRYEDADIYYKQAIQREPKNAEIHAEFAAFYGDWAVHSPDKAQTYRAERLDHLASAIRFDKSLKGPRLALLRDAMSQALPRESTEWAREVLRLDENDPDANYVLAAASLEERTPNVPETRVRLRALEQRKSSEPRRLWITARLADFTGDAPVRDQALAQARSIATDNLDDVDRLALLKIKALDAVVATDPAQRKSIVEGMITLAQVLAEGSRSSGSKVAQIRTVLEQVERTLATLSATSSPSMKTESTSLTATIEKALDTLFEKLLTGEPDLQTYLTYADHLRMSLRGDRCLEVVERALQSPQATRKDAASVVMSLHTVGVEAALQNPADPQRFTKVRPHIEALIASAEPRFQGMGHLFAGSIDLEQSGVTQLIAESAGTVGSGKSLRLKLRSSALDHLRIAAERLPDIAEAQARYGVILVLSGELNLGRQFLQGALRKGGLDPQYQLWAAFSVLQAGYPEEAEPIINMLTKAVEQGQAPAALAGTLHMLAGEIHQARRTPEDLEIARAEFAKAGEGSAAAAEVVVRMAQIDAQLGHSDEAIKRIDEATAKGQGDPTLEQLAILFMDERGDKVQARARLEAARKKYPTDADLVGLDAALLVKAGKPDEAEKRLGSFVVGETGRDTLAMMRAQILAESLKRPDEARAILMEVGEKADSSAPWVQLAGLEIESNRLAEAEAVVRKIRGRWKEAAAADVLEAQIAIKRNRISEAVVHFDKALKKDPDNKVVQFWKASLDGRTGMVEEAARSLENLVRARPVKEVDSGTSLLMAAQSALANLSMRKGSLDDAVKRFLELKSGRDGAGLSRSDHWQLVAAYTGQGNWAAAKREIAVILNDPKNPPSDDDRVRGANFYRQQGELEPALAQLDYVLQSNPAHPGAAVSRAYLLLKAKEYTQASSLLKKAIDAAGRKNAPTAPAVLYLMHAAVENETPPATNAIDRAIAALDVGLERLPDSLELAQAKYTALISKGQPSEALAFIEKRANDPKNTATKRYLVQVYRDRGEFTKAADLLRVLRKDAPEDSNLAAALVQMISLDAGSAAARGQTDREQSLYDQAALMIRDLRTKHPSDLVYLQAECDLVARKGDFERAVEITREIDKLDKASTLGPMLRARLSTVMGKVDQVAQAYGEAIERDPRQLDVRLLLGQTQLAMGNYDQAIEQARLVQKSEKERPQAVLLEARGLAGLSRTAGKSKDALAMARTRLRGAIKADPGFLDAYHTLAEIELEAGDKPAAIQVLKSALAVNPKDGAAASRLVQVLSQRLPDGKSTSPAELAEAKTIAREVVARDDKGLLDLAIAIGFHKALQLDLALPHAETAAAKLDTPQAHLNLGDLLLSIAESRPRGPQATTDLNRAIAEYDKVVKADPNSIEAVNNKAWILHTYLGQSEKALEIVLGLRSRVRPASLPGEFDDTLGSIQEAVGQTRAAEESYLDGLRKAPDHPVLNFHLGKLISADPRRAAKARAYLDKALTARDRLTPSMVQEADGILRRLSQASNPQGAPGAPRSLDRASLDR